MKKLCSYFMAIIATVTISFQISCKSVNPNSNTNPLEKIIDPNAKLQPIIENQGLQFCEGPVWDKENQRLLFSDVMTGKIHEWSASLGLSTFKENMMIPTGNKINSKGEMIHCSGGARGLMKVNLNSGEAMILVNEINGKKLNSPNDLAIKSDGTIWFSDPSHGLSFTGQPAEVEEKGVYCFNPKTKELKLVNASLNQPNGIAFSPDESKLFVSVAPTQEEYEANPNGVERSVWSFSISANNTLSNPQKIIDIGSSTWGVDGMKVDKKGNFYVTSGTGIRIHDKHGEYLGLIDSDGKDIVNLAFGGKDGKTLFALGHQEVFSIDLKVAGLPN